MSHAATNWAIKQRGLKPAAKIVLWQLCDRYNPDYGCFVSQKKLADDCEMSRSALNHWLDVLEEMHLVRRETKRDPKTQRQERTEYFFPFDDREQVEYEGQNPSPESRHGAMSGKPAEPSPENGESRVRNQDSNLVREPVRRTIERDACEREGSGIKFQAPDDTEASERFDRLIAIYPPGSIGDVNAARKAFVALSVGDQEAAIEAWPRVRSGMRREGRDHVFSVRTYLGNRDWERFPKPVSAAGTVDDKITFLPFSRAAWALFRRVFEARDRVEFAVQWIRRGASVPAPTFPSEEDQQALVEVKVGSPEQLAWRDHCRRLGFTLPIPDHTEWIFLPSRNPPPLKLTWKGYHTIEPVSVEVRSPAWWWRLYQEGVTTRTLQDALDDRSHGNVKLTMGPIPLQAEVDQMIRIDVTHDAFHAWDLWFVAKGCKTLLALQGPIWVPCLNPAALADSPETLPDYEAIDAIELAGSVSP